MLFVRNRPEDVGLPSVRELEGKSSHPPRQEHWWIALKGVARTPRIWAGCWTNLGLCGGMLAFVGLWAIPYLRDVHGLDRGQAANYTTVTLAAFAVSTLAAGWLSDWLGRRKPVVVTGSILYALSCVGLAFAPWTPGWQGFFLFALMGCGSGGFIVTFASAKDLVSPALAGMAMALVNIGAFLGAALIQPLFGLIMDLSWNGAMANGVRVYNLQDYRWGFLLLIGLAVVSIVAALRIRETFCRNVTITE
jgi:MFS family permease